MRAADGRPVNYILRASILLPQRHKEQNRKGHASKKTSVARSIGAENGAFGPAKLDGLRTKPRPRVQRSPSKSRGLKEAALTATYEDSGVPVAQTATPASTLVRQPITLGIKKRDRDTLSVDEAKEEDEDAREARMDLTPKVPAKRHVDACTAYAVGCPGIAEELARAA
ncbi:hypothetical protein HPB50_009031 [Hyalomma asiaticum]|uniref:Uncharacterized protein n=1 Tax=Hyalomma asiaticum TaxID=266040 RepID=A0ACB7SXA3_HYAAI|nr:hypothetical protein HPB50_009031 [Hyalomma asiaticum]